MDPDLLQQILGASPDQSGNEQDLAAIVARRKAIGAQQHSTGWGAGLGAIANLIMGFKERSLRSDRDAANQRLADVRQKYGQAFLGTPATSTASPAETAFYGAPETRTAPNPEQISQLAMAGELSGDPIMAKFGAGALARAQAAPKQQLEMEKARRELAMAKKQEEEQAAFATPEATKAMLTMLTRQGVQAPPNTPAVVLRSLLQPGGRMFATEQGAEARRDVAQTQAEARAAAAADRQAAAAAAAAQKESAAVDKRFTLFGQELDPSRGRAGALGKAVESVQQAERDLKLIEGNPNPTDQQIYELARGMDRLISGAAPTIGATEHLIPATAVGKIRGIQQWLTNKPTGADKQAFVAQMRDTIERLKGASEGKMREWQGKKAARYSDLAAKDPDRFFAELGNWGLSQEEFDPKTLAYKGKPKPPTIQPTPAAGAQRMQGKDGNWYVLRNGGWEPE